jgi:hypothetical protein
MKASRILPSAAFAVAVGFFFVPPVLSLAGIMPAASRPQPRLEIRNEYPARADHALPTRRSAMSAKAPACAPTSLPAGEALPARQRSVVAMADPLH